MVVVESDLLPADASVVIIPLLNDYPAVRILSPEIEFGGRTLVLATRLIGGVRRSSLQRVGNVLSQSDGAGASMAPRSMATFVYSRRPQVTLRGMRAGNRR